MNPVENRNLDTWMRDLFEDLGKRSSRVARPSKKVAIISTPRSGSTFFCESLSGTGRFGEPREWLNPRQVGAFARYSGQKVIKLQEYLKFVMERTTTANGVFSINFHVDHFIYWKKRKYDPFSLGFDRVFYIYRRDKLAQSYSFAKARVTDQWFSLVEPVRKVDPIEISNSKILNALALQCNWEDVYARHIRHHVHESYCYEEVMANPDDHFRSVLAACGIEHLDIEKFHSGLDVQRQDGDIARLKDLKKYLGL